MRLRERLLPPWWLFAVWFLVFPAAILVFLPISPGWGVAIGTVLFIGVCASLVLLSPVLKVEEGEFSAGRARIPVVELGPTEPLDAESTRAVLHERFDASNYLCTVPWVSTAVRVDVSDPNDPVTAWVVSTRRPEQLAQAIEAERRSPTA